MMESGACVGEVVGAFSAPWSTSATQWSMAVLNVILTSLRSAFLSQNRYECVLLSPQRHEDGMEELTLKDPLAKTLHR